MATVIGYDQSAKKRTTCRKCAAIIEYVQAEVQSEKHYDYTGDFDVVYFIVCPSCSNHATVKGY